MKGKISVGRLTVLHAAMGAVLGAASWLAIILLERGGVRTAFGSPVGTGTEIAVFLALTSWMAVGAGLSGFILINVERSR